VSFQNRLTIFFSSKYSWWSTEMKTNKEFPDN
jgi:hypothetical protein